MELKEFLNFFDFNYHIEDGKFYLIDMQSANLGGIEEECFDNIEGIVDRLDIYYHDYIYTDICEDGFNGPENYEDILFFLKNSKDFINSPYIPICECICDPFKLTCREIDIANLLSNGFPIFDNDKGTIYIPDTVEFEGEERDSGFLAKNGEWMYGIMYYEIPKDIRQKHMTVSDMADWVLSNVPAPASFCFDSISLCGINSEADLIDFVVEEKINHIEEFDAKPLTDNELEEDGPDPADDL